jgi:hypothetical protein
MHAACKLVSDAYNGVTILRAFVLNSAQYILYFVSGHLKAQLGAAGKVKR